MKETAEDVSEKGLEIKDLESEFFTPFLDRAEERIKNAMLDLYAYASARPKDDSKEIQIETFSFPIAIMLVAATDDSFIKSRFALAEAKRASELLKDEDNEKLFEITKNFNWGIRLVKNVKLPHYVFALRFPIFIKNATGFHEKNWKLVNHLLVNGEVFLTAREVSRLLEEEVRRYIEGKLETKVKSLSSNITARVNQLRQLAAKRRKRIRLEEMPKRIVIKAFPPCIKGVYDRVAAGQPASHMGRFALTSFLIGIGMTTDDVFKFFRAVSDFNERMTRYQVEHIAGIRGSGTKYVPPNCSTLRTHGICISPDPECKGVMNPLVCYKKKLGTYPE